MQGLVFFLAFLAALTGRVTEALLLIIIVQLHSLKDHLNDR